MDAKQFIKVTPKDTNKAYVIPAQNRAYYMAQGATITKPTTAEIYAAFPELKPKPTTKKK